LKTSDFDFYLPDEAIALRPAVPRDSARLLQVPGIKDLSDHHIFDLADILKPGDLLVLNQTRVFPAALNGIRKARPVGGGGDVAITVNLHKRISENIWRAFVKPAKRLRIGDVIHFTKQLLAKVEEKGDGGDIALGFNLKGNDLLGVFEQIGSPPLPPYIARQRSVDKRDENDYQTVYAEHSGSVAAPTAGLHFTPDLLARLSKNGVEIVKLTLHVGAGTFLPVKSEDVSAHNMHSEWFSINANVADRINQCKTNGGRVIVVGTTSLRALESSVANKRVVPAKKTTDIFITPGYEFQIVDGLITNFHLPRSTLFMLVCALAGTNTMKKTYHHAIENGYRFYSYGDSSLIWAQK